MLPRNSLTTRAKIRASLEQQQNRARKNSPAATMADKAWKKGSQKQEMEGRK